MYQSYTSEEGFQSVRCWWAASGFTESGFKESAPLVRHLMISDNSIGAYSTASINRRFLGYIRIASVNSEVATHLIRTLTSGDPKAERKIVKILLGSREFPVIAGTEGQRRLKKSGSVWVRDALQEYITQKQNC